MVPRRAGWRGEPSRGRGGGGVGLQTTAVTRCAATRQAAALGPSPRSEGGTIRRRLWPWLGMHLADGGSPVARSRAGLDNPQGLLETRQNILGVSSVLPKNVQDACIYLGDGYINAIASLGVLTPRSGPSFKHRPPTGACCFICHYAP